MVETTASYIENISSSQFVVEVLVKKIKFDDAGNLLFYGNHRTSLDPETPVDLQLAFVNNSLQFLGFDGIPSEDWQKVRDEVARVFTPEVVAEYLQSVTTGGAS